MKKCFLFMIFGLMTYFSFARDISDFDNFNEIGSGYAFGINMDNSIPIEVKMIFPFSNFGIMLQGGADFGKQIGGHGVVDFVWFVLNRDKFRLPVSLGMSIYADKTNFYWGINGIISYHLVFSEKFYLSFNAEINYYFDNRYEDITGNGSVQSIDSVDGITNLPAPETGIVNHWGSYLTIKPVICIGIQVW